MQTAHQERVINETAHRPHLGANAAGQSRFGIKNASRGRTCSKTEAVDRKLLKIAQKTLSCYGRK